MGLFDSISKNISSANIQGALQDVGTALNTAGKLAGALNNLSNPAALISSLRSLNLPAGGQSGAQPSATALFGQREANSDWRVRLSVPSAFSSSPVLAPLVQAGGLIFPYTPAINITSSAVYNDQQITHQNYPYTYFQAGRVDNIQIEAPFNVEDGAQALYWLAAVHMLRSSTKMFTGNDPYAGNPPPILKLNGYGDYVFKNIPVVVSSFSIQLPSDVNYINTSVAINTAAGAGNAGKVSKSNPFETIGQVAGLAGALGANKVAGALGAIGAVGAAVAGLQSLTKGGAASIPQGGTFGTEGNSWVPVKSSLSVSLKPVYSRQAQRYFSLQTFVNGGYVNGGFV